MKYLPFFFILFLFSCGPLQSVQKAADRVAEAAEKASPMLDQAGKVAKEIRDADSPRDWAGIIEKILYGVGAIAGGIGGGMYLKKRASK